MQRIRASITYPLSGSPGVITLYTKTPAPILGQTQADLTSSRLQDALTAGKDVFCSDTTFRADTFVDELDPSTGTITATYNTAAWTVVGNRTGYLPPANQICVTWVTGDVVAGRRVRGRTFLGPLALAMQEADGSPSPGAITNVQALATAWQDNGTTDVYACVWHRPVGGTGGSDHQIISATVKDKFAVLRSRRD